MVLSDEPSEPSKNPGKIENFFPLKMKRYKFVFNVSCAKYGEKYFLFGMLRFAVNVRSYFVQKGLEQHMYIPQKSLLKSKKARQRLIVLEGAKFVSISVCDLADGNWRTEGGCWRGSVV